MEAKQRACVWEELRNVDYKLQLRFTSFDTGMKTTNYAHKPSASFYVFKQDDTRSPSQNKTTLQNQRLTMSLSTH